MDITNLLYEIIHKYNLDACNSRFRGYLQAVKCIRKLMASYGKTNRLLLIGNSQTDIEMFLTDYDGDMQPDSRVIAMGQAETITKEMLLGYETVLIVSMDDHMQLAQELRLMDINFVDLYDYFVTNGLTLDHPYYKVFEDMQLNFATYQPTYDYQYLDIRRSLFYMLKTYEFTNSKIIKTFYLQKIIFAFLFMKDFIGAKKYLQIYCTDKLERYEDYLKAWNEIERLLAAIAEKLANREQADVVVFWLDFLEYGEDKQMPYLDALSQSALVFENAYTVTPYTQSTFKTLLCAAKVADDKCYNIKQIGSKNSPLIRLLDEKGIRFLYSGFLPYVERPYKTKACQYDLTPTSETFWSVIETLLKTQEPVFLIAHELFNTHWPYRRADSKAPRYLWEASCATRNQEIIPLQKKESLEDADRQLAFYDAFLPAKSTRIYMSDHGHTPIGRFHPVMKVIGPRIPPRREKQLFSYLDFVKLVDYVLEPEEEKLKKLGCECAEIQDVDYYNGLSIKHCIKNRHIEGLFGYHGLVTPQALYIRDNLGKETFWPNESMDKKTSQGLLQTLREKTGVSDIDVEKDDKFRYSKYLYRIYQRYLTRTGDYELKKVRAIRELFTGGGIYALRTGGCTAIQLLLALDVAQWDSIHFIIDRDKDCAAGKLGFPVISPKDLDRYDIDKIVIPSFKLRKELKAELAGTKTQVIDLYAYLESQGIVCTKDFFYLEFGPADFEVGFPFDDF